MLESLAGWIRYPAAKDNLIRRSVKCLSGEACEHFLR